MIVVRYADDIVVGFEHRANAERFVQEWKERLQKFGLEFVPLARERYFFAVERRSLETALMADVLGLLGSAGFRQVINALPGYDGALSGQILTLEEACRRWCLTLEEYMSWQSMIADHGLDGLRSTRTQQYR